MPICAQVFFETGEIGFEGFLAVSRLRPKSFNRHAPPCHPLWGASGWIGLFGMLGLGVGVVLEPVRGLAQGAPSVQSRETRVALLAMFDQLGVGLGPGDPSTRSRANRRHPDVGFLSSDPICLSCVMTVLGPPALPPPPPRQPLKVSAPLLPAPKPVAPKPVASKPAAPKPVAPRPSIITSRLPDVLMPPQLKFENPLEPRPTPDLVELFPLTMPPELLPPQGGQDLVAAQAPVQTPGPLPVLGLGGAIAISRRLRKRIKNSRPQQFR